jgi:hypothetical protein
LDQGKSGNPEFTGGKVTGIFSTSQDSGKLESQV